jgi:predicted transposase YbfD/YdcC
MLRMNGEHGRTTTREVKVYQIPAGLFPDWAQAQSLIQVARSGTRIQGKKSRRHQIEFHERHFYLSSLNYSATEFADAIRGHWSIENRLHWVKDVTLNEDNSIYKGNHAAANWAMVRQFLVSVARHFPSRTLPDALRTIANEVRQVFEVLFPPVTGVDTLFIPSNVDESFISSADY